MLILGDYINFPGSLLCDLEGLKKSLCGACSFEKITLFLI